MKFWTNIPSIVLYSKLLSDGEKVLYSVLQNCIIPEKKYCNVSNAKLAKSLNTSERTITARLESMRKKGFINYCMNSHKHQRQRSLNVPLKEGSDDREPTEEEREPKKKLLLDAFKKAMILGDIDFNSLLEKFINSPYLAEVKDNSKQFAVNLDQVEFLLEMKRLNKAWDCQISYFENVNFQELKKAIFKSSFLMNSSNLGLKFLLENADKIIRGDYKSSILYKIEDEKNQNFKGRTYTSEEWNSCYQSVDDIQI